MSAEMDALVKSASDKLEALEQALHELDKVRGVFASEDGLIETEADGHGALTSLWLAESITQRNPKEIGELIVWAGRQAVEAAGQQRSKIMAKLNEGFAGGG